MSWFWTGDAAAVFTSQGLTQTLSVYGAMTGQQWAINAAGIFTPTVTFVVGTVAIVLFTLLVALRAKLFFWLQNIFMIVGVLGMVVMVAVLATTNPTTFASVLDKYATAQGLSLTGGAYQNITAAGTAYWGGSVPTSLTSSYTFTLIPLWMTVLFWVFTSNYLGGELKDTRTNAKVALFGGFAVVFLATIAILGLAYLNVGPDFLAGAGYYASGYAPNPLPVIPNLTFFTALLSNNPIIVWFIGIGVIAGFLFVIGIDLIVMSRIFFAYSFDRLAPSLLANVNRKWRSPVNSIIVAAVGGEIWLVFLSGLVGAATAGTAFLMYSYAGLADIGFLFTFTCISGIAFPFKNKSLYEQACPIKQKIASVPLITWLGIIGLAYCLVTMWYYTSDYLFYFGAGTLAANLWFPFLGVASTLFIGCIVWYYVARWYRTKGGLPFEKAMAEIPPE